MNTVIKLIIIEKKLIKILKMMWKKQIMKSIKVLHKSNKIMITINKKQKKKMIKISKKWKKKMIKISKKLNKILKIRKMTLTKKTVKLVNRQKNLIKILKIMLRINLKKLKMLSKKQERMLKQTIKNLLMKNKTMQIKFKNRKIDINVYRQFKQIHKNKQKNYLFMIIYIF